MLTFRARFGVDIDSRIPALALDTLYQLGFHEFASESPTHSQTYTILFLAGGY